ncbi:MAG: HNH endonuclease [Anaerolineaceae bacterium]|nr:HNH endonuclease [Anaerolineaceae bacterium]
MEETMNTETGAILQKFKRKLKNANRRAAKKGDNQTLRLEDVIELWEVTIFCNLCGRFIVLEDASIDHLDPLSKGGENRIGNIAIVHRWCNSEKGDKGDIQTSVKFKEIYDPGDTGSILIDSFAAHLLHPYQANPFRRSDLPNEFGNHPYLDQIRMVYSDLDDLMEVEHEVMMKHQAGC